jgi:hypothetical protein
MTPMRFPWFRRIDEYGQFLAVVEFVTVKAPKSHKVQ